MVPCVPNNSFTITVDSENQRNKEKYEQSKRDLKLKMFLNERDPHYHLYKTYYEYINQEPTKECSCCCKFLFPDHTTNLPASKVGSICSRLNIDKHDVFILQILTQ